MSVKNKAKLFFLISITLFAIATFMLTVVNYNPYTATNFIFFIFYLALFVSLFGVMAIILLIIKSRLCDQNVISNFYWPILRQSLLISSILTVLIALKGLKVLDVWVGVPLVIAIILVELYFRGITKFRLNEKQR